MALSVFVRMTAGAEFVAPRHTDNVWSALYRRPDGGEVMILWAAPGVASVAIAGQIEAISDMMGSTQPPRADAKVDGNPIYVAGRQLRVP